MKRMVSYLAAAMLVAAPLVVSVAGGRNHPPSQQDREQKKDTPADSPPAPDAAPIDDAAVTQVLTRISTGAIRRVTANETSDARQIGLIRASLKKQAELISSGVLPSASRNHAAPTASEALLRGAAPGQLRGQYFEVRAGAEVHYTSEDPGLVDALQSWLDADIAATAAPPVSIMRRNPTVR